MLGRLTFDVRVPCGAEELRANVASCLERRLLEPREFEYPRSETLRIVANGPSARRAPLTAGPTAAINGALKLFTERGIAPTYWIACDPQALVADFLRDAPPQTHYLVASKCHPAVFDALLSRGRQVTVWHLDDVETWDMVETLDPVSIAPSVTICVFELMTRLGWRAFETWGWDGCLMEDVDHASGNVGTGDVVDMQIGSRDFQTTGSWTLEAQAAADTLADFPWPVSICGGGMIGAVMAYVWAAQLREVLAA